MDSMFSTELLWNIFGMPSLFSEFYVYVHFLNRMFPNHLLGV
jgi:hypothetical protein